MRTRESFYRSRELRRESRMLPAETYNLARILCHHAGGAVFVPIRSMQYLAVLDAEEFIFVDGAALRSEIVIAWQKFRRQDRDALDQPVAYETVYYSLEALALMQRLQSEFHKALLKAREKIRIAPSATVIPLPRNR
ncbi:hypothetical protein [Candidatus Methylocalor cossyra]|uniref:Uncharacterized protein n=1 Tax=Candidatus Methylocalor cossyra TaxID=3108543 RepID=A0ABP1C8H2_9GAMM